MAKGSIEVRPSGRYRVRWYTRDGRHPSRTFTSKRDAERFLQRAIVESEQLGIDVAAHSVTLDGLIDGWWATVERSLKPRTAERYKLHATVIRRELGDVTLRHLTFDVVQDMIDRLAAQYAPRTVRGTHGVLHLVLADAVRRGKLSQMLPKPILPRVGRPRLTVPKRDQVEALALASDARLFAPIILAGYCGLREGELLALHRSDVHLDDGTVFVHQARNKTSGAIETTKTDRSRNVHLPARVRETMAEHLAEYPGERVVPVSASVLQKSWERARTTCGLPGVRFHDLRHAAASMMIAAGWSVKLVCDQMGHANATQTLDTYTHLWPTDYAAAIEKLDEYLAQD